MSVLHRSIELLEPYDGKLSCTVLRGESARKGADLPDPTLAQTLFYQYCKNRKAGKLPQNCGFRIVNFTDVEYSNPVSYTHLRAHET